jgi:hypothetical protein
MLKVKKNRDNTEIGRAVFAHETRKMGRRKVILHR